MNFLFELCLAYLGSLHKELQEDFDQTGKMYEEVGAQTGQAIVWLLGWDADNSGQNAIGNIDFTASPLLS